MKLIRSATTCLLAGWLASCPAQTLDKLNVQLHGFATQGLLYTTQNNLFTAHTSDGSFAWTEAVLNLASQPSPKLHVAVQARYFLLGEYGRKVTIDWAAADYRVNDSFGVRVGKVKTPIGLFNELQDVDPSYLWALLPQSLYPITSRSSILTHDGAVVYGSMPLGEGFGRLQYRAWGGRGAYSGKDGYFITQLQAGYKLPNNISGSEYGAALHWVTPLRGLMVGVSEHHVNPWAAVVTEDNGSTRGTETITGNSQPNYFAQYERSKLMVAYEYSRNWQNATFHLPGNPDSPGRNDDRGWYAMVSYKLTRKLAAGVYETQNSDHQASLGPDRYQKEWVFAGRYDITPFLYAKAEQHVIRGTGLGYDTDLNPNPQPNTDLSVLKIGVSF